MLKRRWSFAISSGQMKAAQAWMKAKIPIALRRDRERRDDPGQDPPLRRAVDPRRLEQLVGDRRTATCWRIRKMPKLMNR